MSNQYLAEAIALAKNVDLTLDVNPHVGAVVVSVDGTVVGRGWHRGSGTDHAEVDALEQAGGLARGATLYCTLEPCNGTGRVGPCTQAIIAAGISKVVFGQRDPNPKMSGGAQVLAENGIEVIGEEMSRECKALNPSWTHMMKRGRPWVIWKTATTLDGFVAAADGSSKWITGEQARAEVQALRSTVSAIITGTGTVLADNPSLTVRSATQQPLRVVVGNRRLPQDCNLLAGPGPVELWAGGLPDLLAELAQRGLHRVLLECGPKLANSMWRIGAIDEVIWYQAPVVLGSGLPVLGDLGLKSLAAAPRFGQMQVNRVGLDVVIRFTTGD